MTVNERVTLWNRRYEALPADWRFQFVIWSLVLLGTINMALTLTMHFPFALLVILGIAVMAAIRLPYVYGWIKPAAGVAAELPALSLSGVGWVIDVNRRYEALPESSRFFVYPAILLIGGGINMILTIEVGFPFGLLFLLVLLALVAIRAPYANGWLADSGAAVVPVLEPEPGVAAAFVAAEPAADVPVAAAMPAVEAEPVADATPVVEPPLVQETAPPVAAAAPVDAIPVVEKAIVTKPATRKRAASPRVVKSAVINDPVPPSPEAAPPA